MVKNQSTCNRIIFGGLIFLFEALYAIFQVFSDTPVERGGGAGAGVFS